MICIDLAWIFRFPQCLNFMPRRVAKILADLHHDHRFRVKGLQQWTIQPSKLVGGTICLCKLNFQQENVAWQLYVDIRLAVVASSSISKAQPFVIVNQLWFQKSPLQVPNYSAFISLALGSTAFQPGTFLSPGAILQNLDVP